MLKKNSKIIRSLKKLEICMTAVQKGYFYVIVNEASIQEYVKINLLQMHPEAEMHELNSETLHRKMSDILERYQDDRMGTIIFTFPSEKENTERILMQINLMRDMLLKSDCKYIFLGSSYIELYIAEKLPNLYDYIQAKVDCCEEYSHIFEYFYPQNNYMLTKDEYSSKKRFYNSVYGDVESNIRQNSPYDLNELYRSLDYFSSLKRNKTIIEEFLEKWIKPVLAEMEKQKDLYKETSISIKIKTAEMLQMQRMYELSEKYYISAMQECNTNELRVKYQDWYLSGYANVLYHTKRYETALVLFEWRCDTLCSIERKSDDERNINYQIKVLYNCIAICNIQLGKVNEAEQTLLKAIDLDAQYSNSGERSCFASYYNYLLLQLEYKNPRIWSTKESFKNLLGNQPLFVTEEALWLSLCSWIEGVILGNLKMAISKSLEALELKRRFFKENDVKIAESHYINSTLYYMDGKYDKARNCCKKCINILRNSNENEKKLELSYQLLKMIDMKKE